MPSDESGQLKRNPSSEETSATNVSLFVGCLKSPDRHGRSASIVPPSVPCSALRVKPTPRNTGITHFGDSHVPDKRQKVAKLPASIMVSNLPRSCSRKESIRLAKRCKTCRSLGCWSLHFGALHKAIFLPLFCDKRGIRLKPTLH